MSLAALLNLGKKDDDTKPRAQAPEPSKPNSASTRASSSSATLSQEDLKLARDLAKSQENLLAADMEKRAKEEEAWQKKRVEEAAKQAAARAAEAKRMSAPSNPFCTGGQEFSPGVWVCDKAVGSSQPKG